MVRRIYVEKKSGFDVEAQGIYTDLKKNLLIRGLENVRIFYRYDVEGLNEDQYRQAVYSVFSEPPVDNCYEELPDMKDSRIFGIEFLPGQFDQRADSAEQCMQILTCEARPNIRYAKIVALMGTLSDEEFAAIRQYLINPVEAREASLAPVENLREVAEVPEDVTVIDGFISMDDSTLEQCRTNLGLAMDHEDILFCQNYFKETEKRNPTLTEIRMIDTYWSDHCRHTTFMTELTDVEIKEGLASDTIRSVWQDYQNTRETLYVGKQKDLCLMDLATIAAKKLKREGKLQQLDESEEINACSIEIQVDVNGKPETWLLMFKNETHNHPTEIEPFGGAATCLGGAIRDPLSGRSYVYQAMRVTGCGDPRQKVKDTLSGKLPQRKISTVAASGYSSYGNQIGLATGQVEEIYHPGYVAKHMEIGAVVGAVPKDSVVRERPQPEDVVVLLGGRTGRDGCGGATGSSKAHTADSLDQCGAEVQKGNPPEERKIQRLFRKPEVTRRIKRCNDFGAGGVSVAIGELADGLHINLDKVPKKYEGLDGTELAISESQERMAVVVAKEDAEFMVQQANLENIEATIVAEVTETPRLVMEWRGKTIVDISREFLNSNGAKKQMTAVVEGVRELDMNTKHDLYELMEDLSQCSQKGLVERFDSTIGAGTVLMPLGGKYQLTRPEVMAAKIPVLHGETDTASIMGFGFHPYLSASSPFHGAALAIVESVTKVVAGGGNYKTTYLTLQEYFEKLYQEPSRWGKPLAALLGAYLAQTKLGIAAIGGKDSMSGSFEDMDVPPTLVSFAIDAVRASKVVSPEWKEAGHKVWYLHTPTTADGLPDWDILKANYDNMHRLIESGKALSVGTVRAGGIAGTIANMSFGNKIGFSLNTDFKENLYIPQYGSFIVESVQELEGFELLGETIEQPVITLGEKSYDLNTLIEKWEAPLEPIFPTQADCEYQGTPKKAAYGQRTAVKPQGIAKPKVFIPVFPGTNCEYDSARAFEKEGAQADIFVVRNKNAAEIEESLQEMAKRIGQSQIIMVPGGFSAGDEPEGSGKFIAAAFRNPYVKDAVHELLKQRDGLMLGICNGFQALIKLGLVPYGEIRDLDENSPTLTFNTIGRHASNLVRTRVSSVKSPWFQFSEVGDEHTIAISHGEGRFICPPDLYQQLYDNGQIATQYVDFEGNPTYDIYFNPNGSYEAVEGITSPDGRVLGKMGHSERKGTNLYKNIEGNKEQPIFKAGVAYFK